MAVSLEARSLLLRKMFAEFLKEIKSRTGTGYHIVHRYEEDARIKYTSRGISVADDYLAFINEIGFGSFFDGSLVLFSLDDGEGSVISTTTRLRELGFHDVVSIGYDGTTSGFYALSTDPGDERVYWVDIQVKSKKVVADNFHDWIESQPKKLFNTKVFAGFKKVSHPDKVLHVIGERRKFDVKLVSFDRNLVRPPGKENDMLPRYNHIVLSVTKKEQSDLKELTVLLKREGSAVEDDNKEYITLNVAGLPVGIDQKIESYLFDPFNVPFKTITCQFDYRINLGSKMRVRYKEITEYL